MKYPQKLFFCFIVYLFYMTYFYYILEDKCGYKIKFNYLKLKKMYFTEITILIYKNNIETLFSWLIKLNSIIITIIESK